MIVIESGVHNEEREEHVRARCLHSFSVFVT